MAPLNTVESTYLAMLPQIESWAANRHRYLDPAEREEAITETKAWAWQWCCTAAEKGRLDQVNATTLSGYAARMFRSGRRFAGSSSVDVLAPQTKAAGRVSVTSLDPAASTAEALTDSKSPQPFDVCRIDMDYPLALEDSALPDRAAECFGHLVQDNGNGHVKRIAGAMGLSMPRVCQLKNALAGALTGIGYAP